jgi:hypothetical protein
MNNGESLTVFSNDGELVDSMTLDNGEEEDDITYQWRWRVVCFTRAMSAVARRSLVTSHSKKHMWRCTPRGRENPRQKLERITQYAHLVFIPGEKCIE